MKKVFLTVAVAIAMALSIEKSSAHAFLPVKDKVTAKKTGVNYSLREMKGINPQYTTRVEYLQYLANEVNAAIVWMKFHLCSDNIYRDTICNTAVEIPFITEDRMEGLWMNNTLEDATVFNSDIHTTRVTDDGKYEDFERPQKPGEAFIAIDLADIKGFEGLRAAGWHCRIILASRLCANPIHGAWTATYPTKGAAIPLNPPPLQPLQPQDTGNIPAANITNITNINNTYETMPTCNTSNGYCQLGNQMLQQGAFGYSYVPQGTMMYVPQNCIMKVDQQQCRFTGVQQQSYTPRPQVGYSEGVANNAPRQVNPSVVPTPVNNTNVHNPPVLNTNTTVVNANPHTVPGTGGTGSGNTNPPFNLDAPAAGAKTTSTNPGSSGTPSAGSSKLNQITSAGPSTGPAQKTSNTNGGGASQTHYTPPQVSSVSNPSGALPQGKMSVQPSATQPSAAAWKSQSTYIQQRQQDQTQRLASNNPASQTQQAQSRSGQTSRSSQRSSQQAQQGGQATNRNQQRQSSNSGARSQSGSRIGNMIRSYTGVPASNNGTANYGGARTSSGAGGTVARSSGGGGGHSGGGRR